MPVNIVHAIIQRSGQWTYNVEPSLQHRNNCDQMPFMTTLMTHKNNSRIVARVWVNHTAPCH